MQNQSPNPDSKPHSFCAVQKLMGRMNDSFQHSYEDHYINALEGAEHEYFPDQIYDSLLEDTILAQGWSQASGETWKKIFRESVEYAHNLRVDVQETVAKNLNIVGALLNRTIGTGRVGLAIKRSSRGTRFIIMLSSDEAKLVENRMNIALNAHSETVLEVGVYYQGRTP